MGYWARIDPNRITLHARWNEKSFHREGSGWNRKLKDETFDVKCRRVVWEVEESLDDKRNQSKELKQIFRENFWIFSKTQYGFLSQNANKCQSVNFCQRIMELLSESATSSPTPYWNHLLGLSTGSTIFTDNVTKKKTRCRLMQEKILHSKFLFTDVSTKNHHLLSHTIYKILKAVLHLAHSSKMYFQRYRNASNVKTNSRCIL